MKTIVHVSHDFMDMPVLSKINFGPLVIQSLTANGATFPHLPVSIADLTTANDKLKAAWNDLMKNSNLIGAVHESEKDWKEKFLPTANYVDSLANGSEVIITQSGFHHTRTERKPSSRPERATGVDFFSVRQKGGMHARMDAKKDYRAYVFTLATEDVTVTQQGNQLIVKMGDSVFALMLSTRKKVKFEGLPSRIDVRVAAAGFNRAGLGSLSEF